MGGRTHEAFVKEVELLGLEVPHTFTLPTSWGRRYPVLAKGTPPSGLSFEGARELMNGFVDPLLSGQASESRWSPATQRCPGNEPEAPGGRPHLQPSPSAPGRRLLEMEVPDRS